MRLIKRNMAQIIALCEKHKVLQLYVFGSALTGKFNKNSDVDFTVIFDRDALPLMGYGDNYFNFKTLVLKGAAKEVIVNKDENEL